MDSYDPDSGQVFRETIVKAKRVSWKDEYVGQRSPQIAPSQGVLSLKSIAMRSLVRNARLLTPQVLEAVPTIIAHQIWKAIRRESHESFQIWKNFVLSGHGDPTFMRYILHGRLYQSLVEYCRDFSSPTFAWMTDLILYGVNCSISDLKAVSQLANIQTLQIWNNIRGVENMIHDNVLEAWSHKAANDGAFSRLMLLYIDEAPDVTIQALAYLRQLPLLDTVIMSGASMKKSNSKAMGYGWRQHGKDYVIGGRFATFVQKQISKYTLTGCWPPAVHLDDVIRQYCQMRRNDQQDAGDKFSVLTASLGYIQYSNRKTTTVHGPLAGKAIFERDLPLANTQDAENEPVYPRGKTSRLSHAPSAPKKRKIKEGKSIALETLLGDL